MTMPGPAGTSGSHEDLAAPDPVAEVLERVRAGGGRATTARRLLLGRLFESSSHRTAVDLATEVHRLAPDVHLSTIYRNLEELERLGVVVHAHLGHGASVYHLASQSHGHLVCEECGAVVEAPAELFAALGRVARARFGFAVDPRHFAVLGHCAACMAAIATVEAHDPASARGVADERP
jgi:Fe2+ or Zn2+ uptake regulation protein